jgi:hypothetical protein
MTTSKCRHFQRDPKIYPHTKTAMNWTLDVVAKKSNSGPRSLQLPPVAQWVWGPETTKVRHIHAMATATTNGDHLAAAAAAVDTVVIALHRPEAMTTATVIVTVAAHHRLPTRIIAIPPGAAVAAANVIVLFLPVQSPLYLSTAMNSHPDLQISPLPSQIPIPTRGQNPPFPVVPHPLTTTTLHLAPT